MIKIKSKIPMKRLLFIVGFVVCISCHNYLNSNPIVYFLPQAFISELTFNASHDWTLEMEMFIDPQLPLNGIIDSIILRSNSSRARLISFPSEHYALFTITVADLYSPLTINYVQDTLRVITYADSTLIPEGPWVTTHTLVFGYSGCEIPALLDGQSICTWEKVHGNPHYFYLDNSPTIGMENDTIGATVNLAGKFYDSRDSLISYTLNQYDFALPVNVDPCNWGVPLQPFFCTLDIFNFDQQGNYSTTLLSRNTSISNISYLYWGYAPIGYSDSATLACENFWFFQEPGGTMLQDIHLTDSSFLVGLKRPRENHKQDISIICVPNPVSQSGDFFIKSDNAIENAEIIIQSTNGSMVMRLPVTQINKSRITFSREQLGVPGLYFFTLLQNGKPIKSGEIICL
jgi:hypothetical protein